MKLLDLLGYDRHGAVVDIDTTLKKGRLNTYAVTLAALGFNAPAWIAASSMSILYGIVGHAAPLSILIAYCFPMLVLAACLVRLVREAPSAAGVFTYVERFLHPVMGTVLGWTYTVMTASVAPLTGVIGAEYLQALFPSLAGDVNARIIGTIMLAVFAITSLRGIELTAKLAGAFLTFEILVVAGLGLCGILNPHVHNVPVVKLYSVAASGGWLIAGQGILFGVWMLANFDSAINYIEEARLPVRTTQRALILVLTAEFIIYSLAAIGWQYALPVEQLSTVVESGNGGVIGAVAQIYLPHSLAWIALFVVVTSACASMQIALNSGARTMYRMSSEGHMSALFGRVNQYHSPYWAVVTLGLVGVVMVWYKPLAKIIWYYNSITITIVLVYISMLAACIRVFWTKHHAALAALLSVLPVIAILVLLYVGYTAGLSPTDPSNVYQAWYLGVGIVATGILLACFRSKRQELAALEVSSS
jgi:amino acid transporter